MPDLDEFEQFAKELEGQIVEEKKDKTAEYKGKPVSTANLAEQYANQIFPSTKYNQGKVRNGITDKAQDVLRLGMEALTYPARGVGGIINAVAGNPRGGDYGISDTFEESQQGYEEYNAPVIGKVSPMGFVQTLLHDPINALGGAAGKSAESLSKGIAFGLGFAKKLLAKSATEQTARQIAERALNQGLVGATQEIARPLVMETEGDGLDYLNNIIKGGTQGFAMGTGRAAAGIGGKAAVEKLLGRNLSVAEYAKLLDRLARKNDSEPRKMAAALEAASTPEGRAKIAQNHDKFGEISNEILDYGTFDDSKFPESKTWNEFLARSAKKNETKAIPKDADEILTKHGERIKDNAGGGGLTTEETSTAARLKREAEILREQPKAEKPIVLLDQYGNELKTEPKSKVREMNAAQLNDARQRIGKLLNDDWKRMGAGRPDDEVEALKKAYGMLRKHLMDIAEKEGETESLKAYNAIANKLGMREALFERLGVKGNKYKAHDELTTKLKRTDLERESDLRKFFSGFDDAFGTKFSERLKYARHGHTLGAKVGLNGELVLPRDNQGKTGKFFMMPGLRDLYAGEGTIQGAVRKLENAKKPGIAMGLGIFRPPPLYARPDKRDGGNE